MSCWFGSAKEEIVIKRIRFCEYHGGFAVFSLQKTAKNSALMGSARRCTLFSEA